VRFIRTRQVLKMIGVGRTTLWRMVQEGSFPRPVRVIQRNAGYLLEAVEHWMQTRAQGLPWEPTTSLTNSPAAPVRRGRPKIALARDVAGNLAFRAFRRSHGTGLELCAYDWELATLGAPQHDLAELLSFVLSPQATSEEVDHYVELHRRSLQNETGEAIDSGDWWRGFALSLEHLIVNRFSMYTLVCRFQRKRFLERVVPTWLRLTQVSRDARDRSRVHPRQIGTVLPRSPRSVDEPL